MKQLNRLQILLILFVSIVLLFVIQQKYTTLFPAHASKPFADIKQSSISEIQVISNDKTTSLYKKNNHWYTKQGSHEYKADESRIKSLFDSLENMEKGDIVSTNKQKHADLGIGKQKIIFKGDKQHTLYIGSNSGVSENFVRVDDQVEVFTTSNFDTVFVPEDWRDLNVSIIHNEEKVNFVKIFEGNTVTTLEKKGNDWTANGKKAKKDRIDFFLNDIKTLKADDIIEGTDATELEVYDVFTITFKEDNQNKNIDFRKVDDNNYYAYGTTGGNMYKIKAAYVESLKKVEKDFTE